MVSGMGYQDKFQLQVRIEPELHERLLAVAAGQARTVRAVAERAIEREVEAFESSQKKAISKKKTKAA